MLRPGDQSNFETLKRVFANGDAALLECTNHKGEYVAVICAVHWENDEYVMSPFAKMFEGNPYEEVIPPGGSDG